MGGGYYDRDMDTNTNTTSSARVGSSSGLNTILDPKNYKENNLVSTSRHPIVFALDVSGSMSDWPQIIYDKMPMFYGQIMMQKYLTDPSISFCAIADYHDSVIMQVTKFSKASDIDEQITKISLGGGGGPEERCEAYELPGYFYNYMVDFENCELPFFFLTCDEEYHKEIDKSYIESNLGRPVEMDKIVGKKIFSDLMKKYNLFIIKKPYNTNLEPNELNQWQSTVGKERVLVIENPKASVDLILGAIAVTNGLSLEKYIDDMRVRGQTEDRICQIEKSLKVYYDAMKSGAIPVVKYEVEEPKLSENQVKLNEFYSAFSGLNICDQMKTVYENYEKVDKEFEGKIPDEFVCPLTKKMFLEPVKMCDGSVFERQAILKWLLKNDYNPVSEKKFENTTTVADVKLAAEVNQYYESVKNLL